MRGVKRVVLVLGVLTICLAVLAFVLENRQQVALSFLGVFTPAMPVSVFVVISMIVGLILGPLLGVGVRRGAASRSAAPHRD